MPIENQVIAARRRLALVPEDQRRRRVPESQWPAGERWCAGCQTFVPLWYARGSRCRADASDASHRAMVKRVYGMEDGEWDRLFALQKGRCAICGCTAKDRRLVVDHDHKTGVVRGLLCTRDNHDLLGAAHDDVEILRRAVAYLEAPPAQRL